MSRPLNDDEVVSEMTKMVAFIKQEAREKAREIKVKADEEFAIEKTKLVKSEQASVDASYEKKLKAAEVAQKIAQSNLTNKSRLKLLHAREEHLQDLFSTAREQLLALAKEEGRYEQFLEGIIAQGFLQLLEPKVIISARPKDVSLVQSAASSAKATTKDISGRDVEFEVEEGLSDDSAGGILLTTPGHRISLNNSLDERLRLLEESMLPEIRKELFGANENRKFYN